MDVSVFFLFCQSYGTWWSWTLFVLKLSEKEHIIFISRQRLIIGQVLIVDPASFVPQSFILKIMSFGERNIRVKIWRCGTYTYMSFCSWSFTIFMVEKGRGTSNKRGTLTAKNHVHTKQGYAINPLPTTIVRAGPFIGGEWTVNCRKSLIVSTKIPFFSKSFLPYRMRQLTTAGPQYLASGSGRHICKYFAFLAPQRFIFAFGMHFFIFLYDAPVSATCGLTERASAMVTFSPLTLFTCAACGQRPQAQLVTQVLGAPYSLIPVSCLVPSACG